MLITEARPPGEAVLLGLVTSFGVVIWLHAWEKSGDGSMMTPCRGVRDVYFSIDGGH